ncbi:hypothetical protein [Streptomyces sp. NPDC058683]|uniref:hypothetical protein n=1 Tax=Streptomyces sp. NPDC058683 TaxID=3346597 RepID=UPI003658DB24
MNLITMPNERTHPTIGSSARHTPLANIDPRGAAAARTAGRVTDAADRPVGQSIDFNSAV